MHACACVCVRVHACAWYLELLRGLAGKAPENTKDQEDCTTQATPKLRSGRSSPHLGKLRGKGYLSHGGPVVSFSWDYPRLHKVARAVSSPCSINLAVERSRHSMTISGLTVTNCDPR